MKTQPFFATILCFCFLSCYEQKSTSTDTDIISIIIDRTEPNPQIPDIKSIQNRFRVAQEDHSAGGICRLSEISDIEYSPATNFSIEAQSLLWQNPGERKREVASFFASIETALNRLKNSPAGKSESQVFAVIAREANIVAAMQGQRTLYVSSDLMENNPSGGLSFYNRKTWDKLTTDPHAIGRQLEAEQPIKDLHGLKIVLVYTAPDYEKSRKFHLVADMYVKLFQAHDANVSITATM